MTDFGAPSGRLVGGRFTLGAPLGRGNMSIVHEAVDERLSRRVALKQIRFPTPLALRRFQREARLAARLNHPGVPAVYDLGDDYIAMEYIEGRPLQELIAEAAPLPSTWIAAVGLQIAAVLACAHRIGLIHRDIKPSNLLLTSFGTVKVVDFGVSTVVGDSSLSSLTPPGVAVGTSSYRAPECEHGKADARSDLYSLGRVLADLGIKDDHGLTRRDPGDRPSSAADLIHLLRPMFGAPSALPAFVPDPSLMVDLTEAYIALASVPAPDIDRIVAASPRHARAEAERLAAAGRDAEAIAILDAAIAADPDPAATLDMRRDLTRLLVETSDPRALAECEAVIPLLTARLGPDHTAVHQAIAWRSMLSSARGAETPP